MSAIASQSARVSELPHGLCGELMMSSFERSVTRRSSSSVSMRNPLPSRSGMGTGTAPANAVIDSYMGKLGSGYSTSSPSPQRAMIVKNMIGLAPGVTMTRSGDTRIRPVRSRKAATASRSAGTPGVGT